MSNENLLSSCTKDLICFICNIINDIYYVFISVSNVVSQQNQFFRVKPSNADVAEGGTAIIACEVANRRGRVQWTKDGLTLGM